MANLKRHVVTAIPFRVTKDQNGDNQLEFYLHTRFKPKVSPHYSNLLEFPVGGIDDSENSIQGGLRELLEETGLEGTDIYPPQLSQSTIGSRDDIIFGSSSFFQIEMLKTTEGMLWNGPVYLIKVKPESEVTINTDEAKDPKWLSIKMLEDLYAKEKSEINSGILKTMNSSFFELHLPLIRFLMLKLKSIAFVEELLNLGNQKDQTSGITSNLKNLKIGYHKNY